MNGNILSLNKYTYTVYTYVSIYIYYIDCINSITQFDMEDNNNSDILKKDKKKDKKKGKKKEVEHASTNGGEGEEGQEEGQVEMEEEQVRREFTPQEIEAFTPQEIAALRIAFESIWHRDDAPRELSLRRWVQLLVERQEDSGIFLSFVR